jgi:YD repeat-containing protein
VTYSSYDALGDLLTETQPGSITITRVYDKAGRLQKLTSQSQVYVRNCYDGTAVTCIDSVAGFAGGTKPKGRLTRRYGYNPASTPAATVREDFTYSNTAGRLSSKATVFSNGLTLSATQNWSYNTLGLLSGYSHAKQPSGSVLYETVYSYGLPTQLKQDGTLQVAPSISYNPSGGVSSWTAANGVVTTITPDSSLMPRPSRIQTAGAVPSASNFDSGVYSYDGAGNITAIGLDTFAYDGRSRLTLTTYDLPPKCGPVNMTLLRPSDPPPITRPAVS